MKFHMSECHGKFSINQYPKSFLTQKFANRLIAKVLFIFFPERTCKHMSYATKVSYLSLYISKLN